MVGDRLYVFIVSKGMTKKLFSEKVGLDYNNFVVVLKGKRPLGLNWLMKIKKGFPLLNTEWLLFGNGDMELKEAVDSFEDLLLSYLSNEKIKQKLIEIINECQKNAS